MPIAQVRLQGAEALALLRRARELVATRRRWTTGTYARNKQGAPVAPRKETKPTRFCASGAVLYAEHEAHGTWIENRPGLYFETESTRIIGPPRMPLALDMLAAALLGEFALALTRSGRPNERRSDYQRLMLTESGHAGRCCRPDQRQPDDHTRRGAGQLRASETLVLQQNRKLRL